MFGRRMRLLTVLGVAVGIPYAWFSEYIGSSLSNGFKSWRQMTGSAGSWSSAATYPISLEFSPHGSSQDPTSLGTAPATHQLSQVLRFDVSPQWVASQWNRVSTVRAERDLVGLRAPLVTGTDVSDLAGSLTYFFDAHHRLRRLTLHAQTGDTSELVSYVTQTFGMHPEPHLGAGIYLLRWNAKPMNVLRISHAPVMRAEQPHAKFIVEMELNDVHGGYGISSEFAALLLPDQEVRRW
jgi:hypothetical protein